MENKKTKGKKAKIENAIQVVREKEITQPTEPSFMEKLEGLEQNVNAALARLPVAEKVNIFDNGQLVKKFCAVRVTTPQTNEVTHVYCPTKHYGLMNHSAAFKPILDSLIGSGQLFSFSMRSTPSVANMDVYTSASVDGVEFGFRVQNSYDGTTKLDYSFRMAHVTQRFIEVVGYRQVCSNGLTIRVPLDQAEFVREEERKKIEMLFEQTQAFKHTRSIDERVKEVPVIIEAMQTLKGPIERIIVSAQKKDLSVEMIADYIKRYVGKRFKMKVQEQFAKEEQTLWGFVQAMTFVASHDVKLKATTRQTLIQKSAILLEQELRPTQRQEVDA